MSPKVLSSGINSLRSVLSELNSEGKFLSTILTDTQGLPLAAASRSGVDPDVHSAIVAALYKSATQYVREIGFKPIEEITFLDSEGRLLVCRFFTLAKQTLILSALISGKYPYRRLMNRAVGKLKRILKNYWSED